MHQPPAAGDKPYLAFCQFLFIGDITGFSRLIFPVLLLLVACRKEEFRRDGPVELILVSAELSTPNTVELDGRLTGLSGEVIRHHGFLWTSQPSPATLEDHEGLLDLGARNTAGDFSATIPDLLPQTTYRFRAYGISPADEIYYSREIVLTTSGAGVVTGALSYHSGIRIELSGHLNGAGAGTVATDHGFCWSAGTTEPVLPTDCISLGRRTTDAPFTYRFEELVYGSVYSFRAFAVFQTGSGLDTVYGETRAFTAALRDVWVRRADFPIMGRIRPVAASIGDLGFVYTSTQAGNFWAYDPDSNAWSPRKDFPSGVGNPTTAFAVNDKGYFFIPNDGEPSSLWEYDPGHDDWTRRADFPGPPRHGSVAFTVAGKGYLGTGAHEGVSFFSDFWSYDPSTDAWSRVADLPLATEDAISFTIGDLAYVGGGRLGDGGIVHGFWAYDPVADQWMRKPNFALNTLWGAIGFAIGDMGYAGIGPGGFIYYIEPFVAYDPGSNTWSYRSPFPGEGRLGAISFVIKGRAFVGLGQKLRGPYELLSDLWEYIPE